MNEIQPITKKLIKVTKQTFLPPYHLHEVPVIAGSLILLLTIVFTVFIASQDTNVNSHADTANSVEVENGTATGNTTIISDANASGGKAAKFGTQTTPTPTSAPSVAPSATTAPTNKVTRVGSQLMLNGKPYRMVGLDVWNGAIASWSEPPLPNTPYPYADGSNLANFLTNIRATAPHMNTIWFFALQQFATNNGVRDWSSFDKVLSVANQYGFKVVMNLEDSWSYERLGTHDPALDTTWFTSGYQNTVLPHEQEPYRQWVQEVVTHYKNDPRIAVWQPIAEPNAITFSFAQDISSLVKSIDPVTPLSFDEVGPLSASIYALPGVDIPSYHYYADFGQTDYLAVANAAQAAGKPWVMFEYGVNSTVGQTTRANTMKSFLPTMFASPNASGVLNWQNPPYILYPGDPALPVLDSFAQ